MRCLSGNRLNSGSSHCRPNGSSYLRCDEARVDEMDAPVQHNASPSWPKGLRYICPRCRTGIDLGEGQSVRCAHCNFEVVVDRGVHRFISQAGAVNDWQGTYDKVATGSLGDTGAGLLYRSPLRQRVATFRHLCGEVSAGARILDVGCADGVFWQALLDRRAAIGVDFSLEMCVLARNLGNARTSNRCACVAVRRRAVRSYLLRRAARAYRRSVEALCRAQSCLLRRRPDCRRHRQQGLAGPKGDARCEAREAGCPRSYEAPHSDAHYRRTRIGRREYVLEPRNGMLDLLPPPLGALLELRS